MMSHFLVRFLLMTLITTFSSLYGCRDSGGMVSSSEEPLELPAPELGNKIYGMVFSGCTFPTSPIPFATVTLRSDSLELAAASDTSGQYAFTKIPPDDYLLTVRGGYHDSAGLWIYHVRADETLRFDISLRTRIETFESGMVIQGVKDTVSLMTLLDYSRPLGVAIRSLSPFPHATRLLDPDSARRIADSLKGRSYFRAFQPRVVLQGDSSFVLVEYFLNLTHDLLDDWLHVREEYGFFEVVSDRKVAVVVVPVGLECEWIQQFKKSSLFRYLTLNHYGQASEAGGLLAE